MELRCHRVKSTELLFYLAYGIYLFFAILSTSFYYSYFLPFYSLIQLSWIALLLFREFLINRYNITNICVAIIFIIIMVMTLLESRISTIMQILVLLYCARDMEFKAIARFSAWISLILVAFIILSSGLGIINDYVYVLSEQGRERHCLGFRYILYGPSYLFNITALFVYIYQERVRWVNLLILAALNVWIFLLTDARLSPGLSILLIIVACFLKLYPTFFSRKRILCYVMIFSFIICFAIIISLTVTYDSNVPWQSQLNSLLEYRLSYGKNSLAEYGVPWLGQDLQLVGNGLDAYGELSTDTATYNYVDSMYLQILQRYGIIFFCFWIGLLTYTLYRYYKFKDSWMLICMSFIAFHCILDDLSMQIHYNTFWFAVSIVLGNLKNREQISPRNQLLNENTSAPADIHSQFLQ